MTNNEEELDWFIHHHLSLQGVKHYFPPYKHLYNNHHSITDGKNFFVKLSDTRKSLEIELQTLQHIHSQLQPVINYVYEADGYFMLILRYLPHTVATPQILDKHHAKQVISTLSKINHIKKNVYANPRSLSDTFTLLENRLSHPNLTSTQEKQLRLLIEAHVKPYIDKHISIAHPFTHTDVKMDNILVLENNEAVLIDYESVKLSPRETDLASLYQDLVQQSNNTETYRMFEEEFIKQHHDINHEWLNESILFKNVITTTSAIRLSDPNILNLRIANMIEALGKNELPEQLLKTW